MLVIFFGLDTYYQTIPSSLHVLWIFLHLRPTQGSDIKTIHYLNEAEIMNNGASISHNPASSSSFSESPSIVLLRPASQSCEATSNKAIKQLSNRQKILKEISFLSFMSHSICCDNTEEKKNVHKNFSIQ